VETTFIIRLLNGKREVLAWKKITAETRGDGKLWAKEAFVAAVLQSGTAVALNYHWPDVHCYVTVPLPVDVPVHAGEVISLPLADLIHIPSEPLPLPPVTVTSSVTVATPTGHINAIHSAGE
jgi:hypothetical protein